MITNSRLGFIILFICLLSIIFAFFDQKFFQFRFIILFFHTVAIFVGLFTAIFYQTEIKKISTKQIILFIFVLTIVTVPRLFLLKDYPFVSLGDELRDGALDAMKIGLGSIKNIFAYGAYESHGLIIPNFNTLFWYIFPANVLTYRIPSALIGIITLILFYYFVNKNYGHPVALISTLIFSSLGLHLFYSRTETVVIFSGLLTIIDLLVIYQAERITNISKYILVGLILGFNFNFHASVSTTAVIFALIFLFYNIKKIYSRPLYILIFIISLIAGFGPRLLFSTTTSIFHPSRIGDNLNFSHLVSNYYQSLGVYSFEKTVSHYLTHEPILTPIYSLIFFIGIIIAIFEIRKKRILIYPLLALIILPLTNSAITDMVNGDHRLLPVIPVACFIISVGISFIYHHIPRLPMTLIFALLLIYSQYLTLNFFFRQNANSIDIYNWRRPMEYLSMHLIYLLKSSSFIGREICVVSSPENSTNYNYLHYTEQYQFFFPAQKFSFISNHNTPDNIAYVYQDDCARVNTGIIPLRQYYYRCQPSDLRCPVNFSKEFIIYY